MPCKYSRFVYVQKPIMTKTLARADYFVTYLYRLHLDNKLMVAYNTLHNIVCIVQPYISLLTYTNTHMENVILFKVFKNYLSPSNECLVMAYISHFDNQDYFFQYYTIKRYLDCMTGTRACAIKDLIVAISAKGCNQFHHNIITERDSIIP